jgi:type II secretory pathway pseudopilin PulG
MSVTTSVTRRPRAFAMVELIVVFIILAVAGLFIIPKMIGNSSPSGGTTTTNVVTQAETAADTTTAISIADEVYESAQSSGENTPISVSQYATEAQSFTSIAGVSPVSGGAEFTFADGIVICVTTPTADGATPEPFTCP